MGRREKDPDTLHYSMFCKQHLCDAHNDDNAGSIIMLRQHHDDAGKIMMTLLADSDAGIS